MWVKICANTNLEDARLAAEFGADAVGFVFAPSKRQVTAEQVAEIVRQLPSELEKIGVFTTRNADEIVGTTRLTGLTGVQLHGGFDLDLARYLRTELGDSVTIVQTVHWLVEGNANNADEVAAQLQAVANEPAVDRVLIDSKIGGVSGGSGVSFDWSAARQTISGAVPVKLILAGGLRPENLREAIEALDPWGVDVASGVEAFAGSKDPGKMLRFIQNARFESSIPYNP